MEPATTLSAPTTTNSEPQQQKEELVAMSKESLGDRMKQYEGALRTFVDHTQPLVFRIDGHAFSKFTSGLKKPYDPWLHKAMVKTTARLVEEFHAVVGYTQSDEITLVLVPHLLDGEPQQYIFANQVQKLVSLTAACATNTFTNELRDMVASGEVNLQDYAAHVQERLKTPRCYFDSRLFNVPTLTECYNNIYWRLAHDCTRNSVNAVAHVQFSQKQIHGLTVAQVKEKLIQEKNIDWEKMDPEFKYGTFVKKILVEKKVEGPHVPVGEVVLRKKSFAFALKLSGHVPELQEMLFGKVLDAKEERPEFLASYLVD